MKLLAFLLAICIIVDTIYLAHVMIDADRELRRIDALLERIVVVIESKCLHQK